MYPVLPRCTRHSAIGRPCGLTHRMRTGFAGFDGIAITRAPPTPPSITATTGSLALVDVRTTSSIDSRTHSYIRKCTSKRQLPSLLSAKTLFIWIFLCIAPQTVRLARASEVGIHICRRTRVKETVCSLESPVVSPELSPEISSVEEHMSQPGSVPDISLSRVLFLSRIDPCGHPDSKGSLAARVILTMGVRPQTGHQDHARDTLERYMREERIPMEFPSGREVLLHPAFPEPRFHRPTLLHTYPESRPAVTTSSCHKTSLSSPTPPSANCV